MGGVLSFLFYLVICYLEIFVNVLYILFLDLLIISTLTAKTVNLEKISEKATLNSFSLKNTESFNFGRVIFYSNTSLIGIDMRLS